MTPPNPPAPNPLDTRLDWIRDALKWIVGLATGLLTLSATYFYDRFNQAPRFIGLFWLAWGLLILATMASTWATLAAWKNVGGAEFGRNLTWGYNIGVPSFVVGFILLAVGLMINVATPKKPTNTTTLIAVAGQLPEFDPASASPTDPRFQIAICAIRSALADSGSPSALVVGRFDQRELSNRAQSRFASNFELAQRRADQIGAMLTDSTRCRGSSLRSVVSLAAGPRHALSANSIGAGADSLLAEDRRVEIYGFKAQSR